MRKVFVNYSIRKSNNVCYSKFERSSNMLFIISLLPTVHEKANTHKTQLFITFFIFNSTTWMYAWESLLSENFFTVKNEEPKTESPAVRKEPTSKGSYTSIPKTAEDTFFIRSQVCHVCMHSYTTQAMVTRFATYFFSLKKQNNKVSCTYIAEMLKASPSVIWYVDTNIVSMIPFRNNNSTPLSTVYH